MTLNKQIYRFKFQLSSWTIFSWPRQMQVHEQQLGEDADLATHRLEGDSDGLLLRSVALPVEERTVQIVKINREPMVRYVMQRFPRHFIDMQNKAFDAYSGKFSAKTRSTLKRKVKKFAELSGGSLRWERYTTPEELDRFWDLARTVSKTTYQERLLDAGLPDSDDYRERMRKMAAQDHIRAFLLFDRDRPVSYLFCPVRDGILEYAYLGYDPEYQQHSAGTVLQWLALESLFAESRYRYFDFTAGDSEHKRLFGTGQVQCANVALLRLSLQHRLLAVSHALFSKGAESAGQWLEKLGLRSRVRRWIRAR